MLNVSTGNPNDLLRAAIGLYKVEDLAGAERLFMQVLTANPRHPVAHYYLGVTGLRTGRFDTAVEHLAHAVADRPDIAEGQVNYGIALEKCGRDEEALLRYRLGVELAPEDGPPRKHLTALLERRGWKLNEPDEAFGVELVRLAEAMVRTSGDPRTIYAAIHVYERALDQNPDQPEVLCTLGKLMIRGYQFDSAAAGFRAAIGMRPTAEAHHGLATALLKTKEYAAALEASKQAMALEPSNLEFQWTLAQIQSEQYQFDREAARLRAALAKDPGNKELQFKLAAHQHDSSVSSMPESHVVSTFDKHAETFDVHLVRLLQYKGPELILHAVQEAMGDEGGRRFDVLDLGCGTGLCGAAIKPLCRKLAGVDLSPAMIERCRQRGVYDELQVADLLTEMRKERERWDLITAADVLVYVGDLGEVFAAAAAALRPGGLFAFCVERTDEPGFVLGRITLRFRYNLNYLLELGERNGLTKRVVKDAPLRRQFGQPVEAWTVVFEKGK
jgi:predicted TPR repeat methyltransferase